MSEKTEDNPFRGYVDVESRLYYLKGFGLAECQAALQEKDLQKTVQVAIGRRIRKLKKEYAK